MSICYFDGNDEKRLRCEYRYEEDQIIVDTEFNIDDEVEKVNGVSVFHEGTSFKDRDIYIINSECKEYILIRGARYNGHTFRVGTPDSAFVTSFIGMEYIVAKSLDALLELPADICVDSFRLYSNEILEITGKRSLKRVNNDEKIVLELTKMPQESTINVGVNNVGLISISDYWNLHSKSGENNYDLSFTGYLDVKVDVPVSICEIHNYLNELLIFLQLYKPNKFDVDRITIRIGKYNYDLHLPLLQINRSRSINDPSVNDDFLDFLSKCYQCIPYRDSTKDIRNIKYIVLSKNRNIEDNFLMYFRFAECYYKNNTKKKSNYRIILDAITMYYKCVGLNKSKTELENEAEEITHLRNHYVHSGYYLKDGKLNIYDEDKSGNKTLKRTVNADVSWIYDKTKLMYNVAVYIIFIKLLGYSQYKYK